MNCTISSFKSRSPFELSLCSPRFVIPNHEFKSITPPPPFPGVLQISPRMWSLFPQLAKCFDEWAIDYFEQLLVPLDNYITRATPVFLAGAPPVSYLDLASNMAHKALTDPHMHEGDIVSAPRLMMVRANHSEV